MSDAIGICTKHEWMALWYNSKKKQEKNPKTQKTQTVIFIFVT